jgi:hypothetical protein
MHPAKTVRIVATIVSVIYAGVLYLSGIKLKTDVSHGLAYLPSILTLLVVGYDQWAWHWPLIRHLHKRPYLHGLWSVAVEPDPESHIPEGGNWHPQGCLVIEQTFWAISITQFTNESTSYSKATTWQSHEGSKKQALSFVYDNKPKRAHIDRSRQHLGACLLEIANGIPTSMSGEYFTQRFTAGSVSLRFVDRTTNYVNFEQADEYCKSRSSRE